MAGSGEHQAFQTDTQYGQDNNQLSGQKPAPLVRRTLNLKLFILFTVVLIGGGAALFYWHKRQVDRISQSLLVRAEKEHQAGRVDEAVQLLWQYLRFRPTDADARCKLARWYDQTAETAREKFRAIQLLYQALGVADSKQEPELRRRLGELLLEVGNWKGAETEARKLLHENAVDPVALKILALSLYGQYRQNMLSAESAVEPLEVVFDRALRTNPADIRLSVAWADLLRTTPTEDFKLIFTKETQEASIEQRAKMADQLVDKMVQSSPDSAEAYMARFRYRSQFGLPGTDEDLERAAKLAPDDPDVVATAGLHWLNRYLMGKALQDASGDGASPSGGDADLADDYQKAKQWLEKAVELAPSDPRGYLGLGDLFNAEGDNKQAIETWLKGLEASDYRSIDTALRLARAVFYQAGTPQLDNAAAKRTLDALEQSAGRFATANRSVQIDLLMRWHRLARAKWLLVSGDYYGAVSLASQVALESPASQLDAQISGQPEAYLLAAEALARVGRWEQAARFLEQAASVLPQNAAIRAGAGDAWMQIGRLDDAIRCFRASLQIENSVRALQGLCWALLRKQLRTAPSERDWSEFQQVFSTLKKTAGTGPEVAANIAALEATFLAARANVAADPQERQRAIDNLRALAANLDSSQYAPVLERLVLLFEQLKLAADSERVLEKLAQSGKVSPARLSALRAVVYAYRNQLDDAERVLTEAIKQAQGAEALQLQLALAGLEIRRGRPAEAYALLKEIHSAVPSNPTVLGLLIETSLALGNGAEADKLIAELRNLEGEDGSDWRYYRARRLLTTVRSPSDPALVEASKLQQVVERKRPEWPQGYLLKARILELRGSYLEAIAAYKEAIRLGKSDPQTYERLISLLVRAGQVEEASRYLAQMRSAGTLTERLQQMEVMLALSTGDAEAAATLAQQQVEQRPEDPTAWLQLGQSLHAAGKFKEAEQALLKAVQIAPNDWRTTGALFNFYLATKQMDRAREVLAQIGKATNLSERQRTDVLARGYELLGDSAEAEQVYREAVKAAPNSADANLRLARFLLRSRDPNRRAEAEQILRRVLQINPNSAPARRLLATVLAAKGGQQAWEEAFQLLEGAEGSESELDKRLQAILYAYRGGQENFQKTRKILSDLTSDPQQATDGDWLLLAVVDEILGKEQSASECYLRLVARESPNPAHLVAYADFLLRHKRFGEAKSWISKLRELVPNSPLWLALDCRLKQLQGEDPVKTLQQAATSILQGISDQNERLRTLRVLGDIALAVEAYDVAESYYRQLYEQVPTQFRPLAICLAKQGKDIEAVKLCVEACADRDIVILVAALASVGSNARLGQRALEPVEKQIEQALQTRPDDVALLSSVALYYVVVEKLDKATALYEKLLSQRPNDVVVLNNLATLLGEDPTRRDRALQLVDHAIEITGPTPALLDTKGTILYYAGRIPEAIQCLRDAVCNLSQDARFYLHLAAALAAAGNQQEALAALERAEQLGLSGLVLTPSDQRLLDDLRRMSQVQTGAEISNEQT